MINRYSIVTLAFLLYNLFNNISYSQTYGWFVQTSGTNNNLNAVFFVNANSGTAVGNSGTILHTTNAGANWVVQSSNTPNHLYGVFFYDANTGWVSGDVGIMLKTTNGGTTWSQQNSTSAYQLHQIIFLDANTGICAGWYGTILRTSNGGTTWTSQNSGTSRNLLGASFVNSSTVFAVGLYGTIVSTTNAGLNWAIINSGTTLTLEGVKFINATTGIVAGESGRLQKTTNAGVSWSTLTSGTGSWLMSIASQYNNFDEIVGEAGVIRKSSDGGTSWISQVSNTSNYLNSINFSDTNNGTAVGDYGTIIHTTTGGWLLPNTVSLSGPSNGTNCFSLTGNLSWGAVPPPVANYHIQIALNNTFTNIVIDTNYLMGTQYTIRAGALQNNTLYYWHVMANNQVGPGPWSSIRSFTTTYPAPVPPILVSPPNNSTNTSLTPLLDWDSSAASMNFRLRISTDSNFAVLVIDTGNITLTYFNVPFGKLWPNTKYYWKVNGNNPCIAGSYSAAWNFRTMNVSGITQNSGEIPKVFRLYNNYPNPFNPVTQIKFDIPSDNYVEITLYNVLGEEVKTLVSELKIAGSYNYTFNAEGLASGVYIYKIKAGSFTDVKKLVLLK